MYKSNDSKKQELLERLKTERNQLSSSYNLTEDEREDLDRYDEAIELLEFELNSKHDWF